jgi:hypothetical protein
MLDYLKDPVMQQTALLVGTLGAVAYWILKPPKEEQTTPSELELKAKGVDPKESYKSGQ